MNRRRFIATAAAVSTLTGIQSTSGLQRKMLSDYELRLKDVMIQCRGGLIGASASRFVLEKPTELSAFIHDNLSILTPGYDMKLSLIHI